MFKPFLKISLLPVSIIFAPFSAVAAENPIDRIDDPVVMECGEFSPLFGAEMERLGVMALQGDEWTPIPFQIDQKMPDGAYAFTHGPEAAPDPDPTLDANDELVFMVTDVGAVQADGALLKAAGAGAIADCRS